jgi:hypothetical protein
MTVIVLVMTMIILVKSPRYILQLIASNHRGLRYFGWRVKGYQCVTLRGQLCECSTGNTFLVKKLCMLAACFLFVVISDSFKYSEWQLRSHLGTSSSLNKMFMEPDHVKHSTKCTQYNRSSKKLWNQYSPSCAVLTFLVEGWEVQEKYLPLIIRKIWDFSM